VAACRGSGPNRVACRAAPAVAALVVLTIVGCDQSGPSPAKLAPGEVAALDDDFQPLRAHFEGDTGQPRLLILLSPT